MISQQLHREGRKHDAQHRRRGNPEHHDAPALLHGQPGDGDADDDRVVPGQDEVDENDLGERDELGRGDEIHKRKSVLRQRGPPVCPEARANSRAVARRNGRWRYAPPLPPRAPSVMILG